MSNNQTQLTFNPFSGQLDEISVFDPPTGTATLVGGTVTVNTPYVDANSEIFLTVQSARGTVGVPYVGTVTDGVSFVINSTSNTDTSTIAWLIYEVALGNVGQMIGTGPMFGLTYA